MATCTSSSTSADASPRRSSSTARAGASSPSGSRPAASSCLVSPAPTRASNSTAAPSLLSSPVSTSPPLAAVGFVAPPFEGDRQPHWDMILRAACSTWPRCSERTPHSARSWRSWWRATGRSSASVAKLNERVAELLAVAQRRLRKPPPPKPTEPPPVVEGEDKLAFEARPKPPVLPPKEKPKGAARSLGAQGAASAPARRRARPEAGHHRRRRAPAQRPLRRGPRRRGWLQRARPPEVPRRRGDAARARRGGRRLIAAMYAEEERALRLSLTGEPLVAHRRRFIRPRATQLERLCDAVAPTLLRLSHS